MELQARKLILGLSWCKAYCVFLFKIHSTFTRKKNPLLADENNQNELNKLKKFAKLKSNLRAVKM